MDVHDQCGTAENRCKPSKEIIFRTAMLRSDLCDYSDAYIVVDGTIKGEINRHKKQVFSILK